MPVHIKNPTVIKAAGNKPKLIEEYVGRVNSNNSDISIARMQSPAGWIEPAQTPEFDEITFVLRGQVNIVCNDNIFEVNQHEIFIATKGEKIQYKTPAGAEYIAICLPAFSPEIVHREEG
jgi:mannose-6-phosphate isomerase-like protein (cupin superfamily)